MGLDANIPGGPGRPGASGGAAGPATPPAVPAAGRGTAAGEPFDLRRLLASVWRARWRVALVTALALVLGALYLRHTTTLFTARADVLWEYAETNVVDIAPVAGPARGSDLLALESQVEIIRSSRLLGKVVDALALTGHPHFNRFAVAPDRRPLELDSPTGLLRALARVGLDFGLAPPQIDPPASRQREIAIERLRGHLELDWVKNSYVLTLRASAPEAELAARLANAIAGAYIVDQLEKKFEATREATTWLSERVADLRVELEAAERAVEDYSAASQLVSEAALEANARQIKELRERRRELAGRSAALAQERAALAALVAAADYAEVARRLRLPEIEALIPAAVAGDPDATARIESLVAQAQRQSEQAGARAEAQTAALDASVAELEAALETQSTALVELRQLQREAEASRLIYESFLSRLKETSVQEGIQQPDARVLSDAWVPVRPSSPNAPAILGLAAVAGLFVSVASVVLRERMNASFRTADELEAETGLAVLGTVPQTALPRPAEFVEFLTRRPGSSFAEAIRNLRTSVMLANVDSPAQVVMVSSGLPAEGKTTTAVALATISRSLGKSVLVMECDLRRRNFRRYFDIEHNAGLLSVLSGRLAYDEVVHVERDTGLHVLPGEKSPVNAADIFASQRFGEFVAELRRHYDFIIVDTPPVLAVPDARVIAQHADALVYVVRWNKTLRETVAQGLRNFAQGRTRVTGAVLTQIDMRDMARYGYRAYSYFRAAERYYDT